MISLLIGDEFLRSRHIAKTVDGLRKNASGEIAAQKFSLAEDDFSTILKAARELPFLVEKQILIVRRAELLKEEELGQLESYLKNPHPQSVIILEADKVRAKSRLENIVQGSGELRRFEEHEAIGEGRHLLREN